MNETAKRFFELFRSSARSHGVYITAAGAVKSGEKVEGVRKETIEAPPTIELIEKHLETGSRFGLGLVPSLPDGTCYWLAIDLDVYTLDLTGLAQRCATYGLPFTVVRSKSGGAHLYCFVKDGVACSIARDRAKHWAKFLGAPANVEIYPKQLATDVDNLGNWINVPYQSGEKTVRYAVDDLGNILTLDEFLDRAERKSLTAAEFQRVEITPPKKIEKQPEKRTPTPRSSGGDDATGEYADFEGCFSCIVPLLKSGRHTTMRNESIYHLTLAAKFKYGPEMVEIKMREWHEEFFSSNPLQDRELRQTVRSAAKKDYLPKCNMAPVVEFCDRGACMSQEWGISNLAMVTGRGGDPAIDFTDLRLGPLVKLAFEEGAEWQWTINDVVIFCEVQEMRAQNVLLGRIQDALNIVVRPMRGDKWLDFINPHIKRAETVEVPEEASRRGQIILLLQKFCTGRAVGKALDEILRGVPYTENGRTMFISTDFLTYLRNERVDKVTEKFVYKILITIGVQQHTEVLKGRKTTYWSVPSFSSQIEDFDVPREDPGEPF